MDRINDHNIQRKAYSFSLLVRNASIGYRNNQSLFMMLGDDFSFIKAEQTYQSFEKIMDYVNSNVGLFNMSIKYSTPVEYFRLIRQQNVDKKKEYIKDMKKGDFMPYEDQEHKYWTGYYSTRPNLKHMIRKSGRFL